MEGGVGLRSDKGFAEVIAAIIILAVTVAASPALIEITKYVSSEVANANQPSNAYVSVSNGIVTATNPIPAAINLDRIQLTVNGQPVPIEDANHNGVWEPFETITFDLNPMLGKDIVVITLYIDGKEVYRTVYAKPNAFSGDSQYPRISIQGSARNNLVLNISISDDTAVVLQKVMIGDANAVEQEYMQKDVLEEVAKKHGKSVVDLVGEIKEGIAPEDVKNFHEQVSITKDLSSISYIRIVAKDVSGKTSSKIVWLSEFRPEVLIITPSDGQEFWDTDNIQILARAFDANNVSLYIDGNETLNDTANSNPYEFGKSVKLSVGTHTIKARAENAIGAAEDSVTIIVRKDNPPTVRITQPNNGQTFLANESSYSLTVEASASDDRGISRVEFYVDGNYIGNDTSAPYQITTNLSAGTHTIKAVAVDTAGQTAEDSVTVTVTQDLPPQVTIIHPFEGSRYSDNRPVSLLAILSDNMALNSALIYVDGALVRAFSVSGNYTIVSEQFNLTTGNHSFTVVAEDTTGQTTSDTVNFTVYAARPPTITILRPASGSSFVPGDPWIGVVSWDDEWHSNKITLDGSPLKLLDLATLAGNVYSVGPIYAAGNETLTIPNPGLSGKGTVEVRIIPASSYGAATAFRPIVKRGVADSSGKEITINVPTDAVVKVRLQPVVGRAPFQILKKSQGSWCSRVKAELIASFIAPEGAKVAKLVVPVSLSFDADGRNKINRFYYTVSVLDVGKVLSGSALLADGWYYQAKYKTSDHKTIYIESGDSRLNSLLEGYNLGVYVRDYSDYCWVGNIDKSAYIGSPTLKYYTESTNPRLIVDGRTKVSAQKLDLNTRSIGGSFTLKAGKHTLKLVSDYGAFEYVITIFPAVKDPSTVVIHTPWNSSYTVVPGQSITHSGSLDSLFGRFNFTTPDGGVYLVEVRYVLGEVNVP